MGAEDITQEELLAEIAAYLHQEEPVRPGPEWFTIGELLPIMRETEPNLTAQQLRDRLNRKVELHKFDKVSYARNTAYYRKL